MVVTRDEFNGWLGEEELLETLSDAEIDVSCKCLGCQLLENKFVQLLGKACPTDLMLTPVGQQAPNVMIPH